MVWSPPPDVRAAGEAARVRNNQGSVIQPGQPAQLPISPAVRAFYAWVLAHFPGVTGNGMARDSSRNHQVGQRRDVHEEGRACDFKIRPVGAPAGTALANWLVRHAEHLGVQLVIWDRLEWSSSPIGTRFENYRSPPMPSPHDDHVHAELSIEASQITAEAMRARLDGAAAGDPPASSGSPGSPTATTAAKVVGVVLAFAALVKVLSA
jgi:hypothetical protein